VETSENFDVEVGEKENEDENNNNCKRKDGILRF
jgi:hypothetical protein